jgi:hypothetical protein
MVGMLGAGVNFAFAAQPTGSITVANVTSTSATLRGVVNPNGAETTAWFETMSGGPFQTQILGNGTTNVDMLEYELTGLTPGQTYQARVYAGNADGILFTNWTSFTTTGTPAAAPTIGSVTVSGVTTTSATLNGVVNPNGAETTAWFETMSGGPFQTQNLGSGTNEVTMLSYTLTGLTPSTTYQFRVYAGNNIAPVFSNWVSFTTQSTGNGNSCPNGPTITSLSPDNINEGAAATTVTVNGTNFIDGTTEVLVDGSIRTINSITSTSLTITLTAAELASNGNITITVRNGGCSDNEIFTVNNITSPNPGGPQPHGGSVGPDAVTVSYTNLNGTSATLNGTIDPNNHSTTGWFEYGTSSTLSSSTETTHVDMGSDGSPVELTQNISGLTPNTTYYFRAVGKNSSGTDRGEIKSFVTSENTNGIITTIQATNQLATSAKLNGLFVNTTGESVQGWFEYGKTSSMNSSTTAVSLGSGASLSFSKTVTGLTPDTIYYFRAAAKRAGVTYKGDILVFKTKALVVPVEPTNTENNTNTEQGTETEDTNIASSIFTITTNEESVEIGKEITYTVTYENNSDKNLENTVITIQLPDEIDFLASDLGIFSDNNTVVLNLGTLVPSQNGTLKVIGKVNNKAADLGVLVTTGIMSYTPAGSTFQRDEIAYVTNKVNPSSDLGAASIWGYKSFLPSTLLGWLAVILVILGFTIVGKNLYAAYAYRKSQRQYEGLTEEEDLDNIDLDSLPKV